MEMKSVLYEELHPTARPPWVVVATPHEEARQLIAGMLRDQGLEVSELGDATEMFGRVLRPQIGPAPRRPDLLVLEAEVPGVRGLEIVQRLRGVASALPVVLLTPRMDSAMAEEAEALGIECVLEHPFDYADLRAAALAAIEP
jgi:two-component system, chemotaxis family, CheB/CheR fusion protein